MTCAQFLWKTIREKVTYAGRTRPSDRAGKTRMALLDMRTTLQETPTAKSMQVHDKNILLLPNFDLSKMSHSESEFYQSHKLSYAEKLQSPIHSDSKEEI